MLPISFMRENIRIDAFSRSKDPWGVVHRERFASSLPQMPTFFFEIKEKRKESSAEKCFLRHLDKLNLSYSSITPDPSIQVRAAC